MPGTPSATVASPAVCATALRYERKLCAQNPVVSRPVIATAGYMSPTAHVGQFKRRCQVGSHRAPTSIKDAAPRRLRVTTRPTDKGR